MAQITTELHYAAHMRWARERMWKQPWQARQQASGLRRTPASRPRGLGWAPLHVNAAN